MRVTLREYQQQCVDRIRDSYGRGNKSVLLALPTGGGKTICFCFVVENAVAKGRRVAILVHRQELVDQTGDSLEKLGVEFGVIAPGQPEDPHLPVQVCSVQSLVRRLDRWRDAFDLLVIDEAHHAVAGSWRKVIDAYPNAHRLGVSATPERLDGKGLADHFDDMVIGPGTWDLMQMGHLSEARIFCPPTGVDFKKLKLLGGDFRKDDAEEAMTKASLMGDVVDHYKRLVHPMTAIAFCVTVEHAKSVAAAFNEAGVRAAVIDGTLDRYTRKSMIRGLETGDIEVLCSCEVISEGTDVPSVGGALLLRPTASLGLYLQQVGRCLRKAPGKTHAVILDHAGNVARHGLPQDVHLWSLEGEKVRMREQQKNKAPIVRVCLECFAAVHGDDDQCPYCGAEMVKPKPKPEAGEGELREVKVENELIRLREEQEKKDRRRQVGRARSLAELKALAKERGYSPGWAYHIHNSRKGRGAQL